MSGTRDPDGACPICGKAIGGKFRGGNDGRERAEAWAKHRCPESSLRGIDGARRRDPDDEGPRAKAEADRLREGLRMLGWGEADDPKTW
jgi:hypothetical protein